VLFALVPEDRLSGRDRLDDSVRSAHFSRSLEDGEDLGEGRGMPKEPTSGRDPEDRRLNRRPLFEGGS
jgi:hypothetical protein